jgi:bifunctional non-homologous end joining protein LigD
MSLDKYRKKRDFSLSPEPAGEREEKESSALCFVVHKHKASHLHYDLRLELDGVLKSWAIPKGPSLDPSRKRLAVMVEDHPLEYRDFEGTIPEGNYGAGTVMIWDEGTYSVPGTDGQKRTEEEIRKGLDRGNVYFTLDGKKLKGAFHLVRLKRGTQENSWLLIKKDDQFATEREIPDEGLSARSGRTLEQIRSQDYLDENFTIDLSKIDLSGSQKAPPPPGPIQPMLSQLVGEPFDRQGWVFEIKWDGYRAIAEVMNGKVKLYSRKGKSFLNDYPPLARDLEKISFQVIFDGEIVVLDSEGRSDFHLLQDYRRTGSGDLAYYIFDLLYLEGYDLRSLPLLRRKSILKTIIPALPRIRYSDHIHENGKAFFELAKQNRLEGIMAKEGSSSYMGGTRTWHWQKIKATLSQEIVIGGFTEPRGGRTGIGALLGGVYEDDELVYAGSVGSGFTDDELPLVREKLIRFIREDSPFRKSLKSDTNITWVDPVFVCEVKFSEWTPEGLMRQPVFLGFREDVDARQIRREIPVSKAGIGRYAVPESSDKFLEVSGKTLKLTNLNKYYWPGEGITKGDTIDYYRQVAPFILPHLIDRPESLHRFPDGINGKSFFHKDMSDVPEWIKTEYVESDIPEGRVRYLLCQDEASLVYMVNLGAIEINPWISRVGRLDRPDYMVIDLDPLDCPFEDVIETALVVHRVLQSVEMPHYVKTSGSTGMHIFVPLGALYSYSQAREFSALICTIVNGMEPSITSMERPPERRRRKVYLDFLQNIKGKTMASVYSLRPRPGAPVSTPLNWEEVKAGLNPQQFTREEVMHRLAKYGDLWKPVLGDGIDMKKYLSSLWEKYGWDKDRRK